LLNCSGTMQGTKIVQANNGVQLLSQELMADPRSASTVCISIIPFAETAFQMDLVPIATFSPPQLSAYGRSALGAALCLLNQSLDQDILQSTPSQKGDYKPLVFLLTDSNPTDAWQGEAWRLATRKVNKPQNVVALAIGDKVDLGILRQITPNVLQMDYLTADALRAFFQWVSAPVDAGFTVGF
jgi:uncharacterized protein YegL